MTTHSPSKSHVTATLMTRASKKLLATIFTAIFAAGAAAGYWVPPAVTHGNGLMDLRSQHNQDIASVRAALDVLTVSAAKSEAKLDLLVQMVRDHTQKDK